MLTISKVLTILALPLVVSLCGGWLMLEMSKSGMPSSEGTPLYQRLGYDINVVARYWNAFKPTALNAEQHFLRLDLIFPLFYGAAFGISLYLTWDMLGRPFSPLWIIAPVAITALADWTENLIQLNQLKQYREHGEAALQANLIQIASLATCIKLIFFYSSALFLVGLVVIFLFRLSRQA